MGIDIQRSRAEPTGETAARQSVGARAVLSNTQRLARYRGLIAPDGGNILLTPGEQADRLGTQPARSGRRPSAWPAAPSR